MLIIPIILYYIPIIIMMVRFLKVLFNKIIKIIILYNSTYWSIYFLQGNILLCNNKGVHYSDVGDFLNFHNRM